MKCQACPNDHDTRVVTLINGSKLRLCAFHRKLHDTIIVTNEERNSSNDE